MILKCGPIKESHHPRKFALYNNEVALRQKCPFQTINVCIYYGADSVLYLLTSRRNDQRCSSFELWLGGSGDFKLTNIANLML